MTLWKKILQKSKYIKIYNVYFVYLCSYYLIAVFCLDIDYLIICFSIFRSIKLRLLFRCILDN